MCIRDSLVDSNEFNLNQKKRAALMERLQAASGGGEGVPGFGTSTNSIPLGAHPPPMAPMGAAPPTDTLNHDPGVQIAAMPQRSILLRNMFDPSTETDPAFDLEIKEDVSEECSRYGAVEHVAVGKNTPGFVYVRFTDTAGATNAKNTLSGRWFAGKMISVDYLLESSYSTKFNV
eukprot:TRINITY_DN32771_c0_g1_i1.p1 TRINITY_DN32771_c0_g1~~TRINITY_DN32771_c0_g1_i1.p1  ORF type:complete len:175 (-),score=49.65 TRINITY_DN32771_c0_g1_i1:152-676(-)